MTAAIAIKSALELLGICLLIWGLLHEKKLIAFEQKVWRILYVNYRRYQRKKKYQKMQKNRDFRVVNGSGAVSTAPAPRKKTRTPSHVA